MRTEGELRGVSRLAEELLASERWSQRRAVLVRYEKVRRNAPIPFSLLNPIGYVMPQQFNIQQLYALPTLYLCVLYLSENKQRLVPLTA